MTNVQIATPIKRRPQSVRREESRASMLKAAVELIADQGFTGTSLDEIGLRAGYSRGLVSHTFGSKTGLAKVLVETIAERVRTEKINPALQQGPGFDPIEQLIRHYVEGLNADIPHTRALYVLMFESLGPLAGIRDDIDDLSTEFIDNFRQLIAAAQSAKQISGEIDPIAMATHIVSHLRGISLMTLTTKDYDNIAACDEFIAMLRLRMTKC